MITEKNETRRVMEHMATTADCELLQVITVFETGINKETIRKMNPYTKKIDLLVHNGEKFDWIR
jgi:hypothetical protein